MTIKESFTSYHKFECALENMSLKSSLTHKRLIYITTLSQKFMMHYLGHVLFNNIILIVPVIE